MKLVLIAAVARDGGIGRDNGLIFADPIDQKHFRATTLGAPVVMGRRTWLSLPERFRPLPGRRNVVLSRDRDFAAPGAEVAPSLEHALERLRDAETVFVIGGADVYAQALPQADELVLTEVDRVYEDADAFFPAFDRAAFVVVAREAHVAADGTPFAFVTYRRRLRRPGSSMQAAPTGTQHATHAVDSRHAWARLAAALALMTIGSSPMYVISVVLPAVQADFGVVRADASLPYTLLMIGFGLGGIAMGRLADRRGMWPVVLIGTAGLTSGYVLAGLAGSLWAFALVHGLLLGACGSAATFAPLVADTTGWFVRRRGIAVAICASGNYLSGTLWPPIVQPLVEHFGWRPTFVGLGLFCALTMPLLATRLRARSPAPARVALSGRAPRVVPSERPFGLSLGAAQTLLSIAGVACCVAMAMPQVHIVAYCGDLGYGVARGAEMLSLMLGFGILSRLVSGAICDRIGGLRTLLLGSALQGVALLLFIPFDGLVSLYLISALFGLFQGGIVPSYAIIVREHFPPQEAGARVGTVLMATLLGMALGGWMSGKVFDLTGSYDAAFVNGLAWNALNLAIALFLLWRTRGGATRPPTAPQPLAAA